MKNLIEYIMLNESIGNKVQPKTKDELIKIINDSFEKGVYDLNFIDTSKITDMSWLFEYISCNFDISNWDVSNVKDMTSMFYCCKKFDCDLSNWNVSNVINMGYMFYNCKNFNCDLSNWDVSKVKNMNYMFYNCKKFNCDLSDWDISNITLWKNMFDGCDKVSIPSWYKK